MNSNRILSVISSLFSNAYFEPAYTFKQQL